jgi:hypothetical protein
LRKGDAIAESNVPDILPECKVRGCEHVIEGWDTVTEPLLLVRFVPASYLCL